MIRGDGVKRSRTASRAPVVRSARPCLVDILLERHAFALQRGLEGGIVAQRAGRAELLKLERTLEQHAQLGAEVEAAPVLSRPAERYRRRDRLRRGATGDVADLGRGIVLLADRHVAARRQPEIDAVAVDPRAGRQAERAAERMDVDHRAIGLQPQPGVIFVAVGLGMAAAAQEPRRGAHAEVIVEAHAHLRADPQRPRGHRRTDMGAAIGVLRAGRCRTQHQSGRNGDRPHRLHVIPHQGRPPAARGRSCVIAPAGSSPEWVSETVRWLIPAATPGNGLSARGFRRSPLLGPEHVRSDFGWTFPGAIDLQAHAEEEAQRCRARRSEGSALSRSGMTGLRWPQPIHLCALRASAGSNCSADDHCTES